MKKIVISALAASALAIGFAGAAKADPTIGFGFTVGNFSQPQFALGITDGYGPGYMPAGYGYGHHDHHGWGRPRCVVRWVNGWYRGPHHHMVYGPHPVRICR